MSDAQPPPIRRVPSRQLGRRPAVGPRRSIRPRPSGSSARPWRSSTASGTGTRTRRGRRCGGRPQMTSATSTRASSRSPPACSTCSAGTCVARATSSPRASRSCRPYEPAHQGHLRQRAHRRGAPPARRPRGGHLPYLIPPVIRFTETRRARLQPMTAERVERDSMGEVRVPAAREVAVRRRSARSRTSRSPACALRARRRSRRWPASRRPSHRSSGQRRMIEPELADAIIAAADAVARGEHDDQFPIDVFQTGSGTSSNMNMNEVLATLAEERARPAGPPERRRQPPDVVERHVPGLDPRRRDGGRHARPRPGARAPCRVAGGKAGEFAEVVKAGRTHLMDATPVTLGQEFGGYAAQVRLGVERLQATLPRVAELPLGGTAVGTGINAPRGIRRPGHRGARVGHRAAADRGARPLRGAGRPGRARGALRAAAHDRGEPHEDLERPALDGLRPARRPRRDQPARPPAR